MKIRCFFAAIAAALVLSACNTGGITGPDTLTPADRPAFDGGWAGGGGRSTNGTEIPAT